MGSSNSHTRPFSEPETTLPTLPQLATQAITRCHRLALCTETAGTITRTFLSPPMHEVHALLRSWMEAAGLEVHVDAIGNLRGLYPAATPDAPRLLLASHLDTVPNAGPFDGILGVTLALALIESLDGHRLPFAIELIGFSEEEGVRFGKPFLGSLALTGQLDTATLARTDAAGITLTEAIRHFDLDPARLPAARLSPATFAALEFHIEQGPVLECLNLPLAAVSAIAGQTRLELRFTGQANHAGTTPMALRRDALAAAAAWIVAVEAHANATPGLVATVGRLLVSPGATNIIPGEVLATLDLRHPDDPTRQAATVFLEAAAHAAAATRGVTLTITTLHDQPAVPLDSALTALLQQAATLAGHPAPTLPSGAGHDAMILAPHLPTAMLFLRSPAGLSHHPDETVLPEDVLAALTTATHLLRLLQAPTPLILLR